MLVTLVGPEFEENLSLRYLAAALRQAGHTASMARFDSLEYMDGVVQQVMRSRPGIVGLSMVFQVRAREFYALARALRAAGYDGHITAGGHFATFAYEKILQDVPEISSIIRQEGEITLVELADALDSGQAEIAAIPGMVVRASDGAALAATPRQQVANLDALPFPVRGAEPERHLGVRTAFMVGSRGCYADCEYCSIFAWHEAAIGKRYRLRSIENIAEEMRWLYEERGVRFFVFHDDNFFLPTAQANRKRFELLRAAIKGRGMNDIGIMLKLRPNDCDRQNMEILKDIGLLRAFVGIENASQRQLRSLGRDSTVEDVEACLGMLRELDIYATYNILLFDPYTRLEDVATNIRFLRRNLYFPFNWCKVEPYAGTELEKRYGREGRLVGDYLGHDYRMDDERARLLYDLLLPAFYYRNFNYYGLANLNIGLGYHRQLLKRFYPERSSATLCSRVQQVIEGINTSALDLLEAAHAFASTVALNDTASLTRFGAELNSRSFEEQRRLGRQVEDTLREIEMAAGVRAPAGAGVSEAFTPLNPPVGDAPGQPAASRHTREPMPLQLWLAARLAVAKREAPADPARRRALQAAGMALVWMLAGCRRQPPAPESGLPAVPVGSQPVGFIDITPGRSDTAAPWETLSLRAVLLPADAVVIGEPRVVAASGTIAHLQTSEQGRVLSMDYQPEGGNSKFNPNVKITVAWNVRRPDVDSTVVAEAFVHVREDGSYAFGYETPRPTIAEMAAPPIYRGPSPSSKGGGF